MRVAVHAAFLAIPGYGSVKMDLSELLFGNRFDEFPWSCWNFNSVYPNIPSFLLSEIVYSLNFFDLCFSFINSEQ